MRRPFYCFSFLLSVGLAAPLTMPAQTPAPPPASTAPAPAPTPVPAFQPSTLLKLGTGLTRGLTIGGYLGTALPVVGGVERQVAPAWSLYGNVSSGWRVGARSAAPERGNRMVYITELGLDLGVRHYYNQEKRRAAGRDTGPFTGHYVALQATNSFAPFPVPKLRHEVSALAALWGTQHRLGGHGLVDGYAGGGVETRQLGIRRQLGVPISLHLEVGVKLSLVP